MKNLLTKRTYLGACLAWTCYVLLFPNWIGFSYSYSFDLQSRVMPVHRNGTRGLLESSDWGSPLWKPPTAAGSRIRWPWQYPNCRYHVEIHWLLTLVRISAGIIVFGTLFCALPRKQKESFFGTVELITVTLVVVLLLVLLMACAGPMSVWEAQFIAVIGLVFGAVVDLAILWWSYPSCRNWLASCIGNFQLEKKSAGNTGGHSRNRFQPSSDIPGFAVGIFVGMIFNWIIGLLEVLLRGRRYFAEGPRPDYEISELYELAAPLDIAGGVAIFAIGWSLGGFLFLRGRRRGFSVGLLVTSTLLGIAFVSGF